ncbi:MAG TPA: serine/threonine-protein kinase, partial [Thermoanaerobaculia bacterium]|nr:serine/threonine-protein kinase [Thermoanaerobaculia bacterium]
MPASTLIGRYEVIRELGRGAMGTVFLARDTALGRLVALKTFRATFEEGGDPENSGIHRRRSLREAQRAGTLSHPSVITIYDVVESSPDEDSFYIVMEYVEGQGLDARMRERGPMQLAEVAPLVTQIASALDHLHERGIVHRDVKPGNVLVAGDGRIKITDFGIARSEDPGATLDTDVYGTPYYMAPEQIQGRPLDARTDVFALGVVVYEMLTGTRPFPGATVAQVAHRIVYGVPAEPEVDGKPLSAAMREVLGQALAKDPAGRYPTAGALAAAVQDVAEATGNLDLDATTAFPRKRWLGDGVPRRGPLPRTPLVIGAVAAVVVLLLLSGFVYLRSLGPQSGASGGDELQARQIGYVKFVSEGKRLLAENDPQGAMLMFQAAEGMAIDPGGVQRLREEAERLAEEQGAHLRLLDARADLANGDFEGVVATAREMMETRAGREKAAGVLAEVQEALARGERMARTAPAAAPRRQTADA